MGGRHGSQFGNRQTPRLSPPPGRQGHHQLVVALPRETVALLDEFKERQGLRNRSQALLQLIEQGRGSRPAVIDPETRKPALPGGLSKLVTGLEGYRRGRIAAPNLANRRRRCQRKLPFPSTGEACPSRSNPERRITMAQENCALGAPQGRRADAPTGFRRLTPGLLEGRPHGRRFRRPAGGRDGARPAAGRLQGGGAAARHRAAPGACGRLAVPLHAAAGLGEGQPADRLALGPRCSRRRSACRRPRSRRSTAA